MTVELFLVFATATLTFALKPGPSVLYVIARTLAGGRSAGLMATAGIHLGGYAHVAAAVAGLAIVLHSVPLLYTALKIVGALYLIWLGIGLIRSVAAGEATELPPAPISSFRQSVLVEVLNPKAALFYLAFLPQFTTPEASLPVAWQLLVLGMIVNFAFSLSDVLYVLATNGLHRRLASNRAVIWVKRTGGAILIGLGLNVAISRS